MADPFKEGKGPNIDESNPFSRDGDEVELYRHYGSGGHDVAIHRDPGVAEGLGVTALKGPHGSLDKRDPMDGGNET